MKKSLLLVFFSIISIPLYSQVIFEPGYFINNSGEKVSCLIKNVDWQNNPTKFDYRMSEGDETLTASLESVSEFGIIGVSKYVRSTVNIDRSSEGLNSLSTRITPEFSEETHFLKVIIDGRASLFQYKGSGITRYFFRIENGSIEQLISKLYRTPNNNVAENDQYRTQLLQRLQCENITFDLIEKVRYRSKDLANLFKEYNQCVSSEFISFDNTVKRKFFNLSIQPGINISSLKIDSKNRFIGPTDFGSHFGFRLGVEAEFILPFNKGKWSLVAQPAYRYYESERDLNKDSDPKPEAKVEYSSVEFPVGVRHYFFLNPKSKVYLNTLYIVDFSSNSGFSFTEPGRLDKFVEIQARNNIIFGTGYTYNNKFSIGFRYIFNGNIIKNKDPEWNADFTTFSLTLGYTILSKDK